MSIFAVFGLNVLAVLVSSVLATRLYLWSKLRIMERNRALASLVAPHMFLRFIGLSFLVLGVVSLSLPAAFAIPAAWGDFGAGVLAIAATVALLRRTSWAVAATWLFNLWGTADFVFCVLPG